MTNGYVLHFNTGNARSVIHRADCRHNARRYVRVIPVTGRTVDDAMCDETVVDLLDREYTVAVAPCCDSGATRDRR